MWLSEGIVMGNTKVFQPYREQLSVAHGQRGGHIQWVPLKVCLESAIFQCIH